MHPPPHSDAVEKGDHNFYTEKDAEQPPTPQSKLGKGITFFCVEIVIPLSHHIWRGGGVSQLYCTQKNVVPFPNLLWGGGGLLGVFFCIKIIVPPFPPHLSGGVCMNLFYTKKFGVRFSLKQIRAQQHLDVEIHTYMV